MRFCSLGSGSGGNATVVEARDGRHVHRVVIDCGFSLREFETRLARAGLQPSELDAVFVTHEHGDHVGCALGLARLSPPDVLTLLAELLADPEHGARTAAARALGCTGQAGAAPLLRFKALVGDDEPLVLAECLTSLLSLEQAAALPFVRRFLLPEDEPRGDAAALALGQSRLPEAVPLLKDYADAPPRARRKAALVALAMLRRPEANDHLLEMVREAEPGLAALAVEALALSRHDSALHRQVAESVAARRSPVLSTALARAFGPGAP